MTSILTNSAAMAALNTLRSMSGSMEKTQNQVSSGLRVGTASDNAAYWSIATTMRSDNKALSAVQDALGLGAAVVDTAYAGMSAAEKVVSEFKAKLVAAKEPGVDKAKINSELTQLKEQMRAIAYSASFNGQNWLALTEENWQQFVVDRETPAFISRNGGSFSVGTIKVMDKIDFTTVGTHYMYPLVDDTAGAATGEMGILTSRIYSQDLGTTTNWVILHTAGNPDPALGTEITLSNSTTSADIDEMISITEVMHQDIIRWATHFGAIQSRVSLQQDFAADLSDTIDRGIGRLVDADMNEASTRLKALQTQEQLGIQALQIANASADNVMQLFR